VLPTTGGGTIQAVAFRLLALYLFTVRRGRVYPLYRSFEIYFDVVMEIENASAEGPSELLEAVLQEIPDYRNETGLYYYGIVSNVGGGGRSGRAIDHLNFHLRDGVDSEHAEVILNAALDDIAEKYGLTASREEVTLSFER
jgi:hypothetical protein